MKSVSLTSTTALFSESDLGATVEVPAVWPTDITGHCFFCYGRLYRIARVNGPLTVTLEAAPWYCCLWFFVRSWLRFETDYINPRFYGRRF